MSWSPAVTAQQLGLDQAHLDGIIQATSEDQDQMRILNNQVSDAADAVLQHMQSDPGQIVHGRLATWCSDFQKITNDLGALNDRVTNMRNALVQANTNAGGPAGGQPGR